MSLHAVTLLVVLLCLLGTLVCLADVVRSSRRAAGYARQAEASRYRAQVFAGATLVLTGRWDEVEHDARRIVADAERSGRYGYEALLVTWRQVADTLPADVVAALEPPRPPAAPPAPVEESGGPYGRVLRWRA